MLTTEEIIYKRKKEFLSEVRNILIIISVLLVFRSVFYEPYRIPSGSMIPALRIGDFILVEKFSYGFKVPYLETSAKTGENVDQAFQLLGKMVINYRSLKKAV